MKNYIMDEELVLWGLWVASYKSKTAKHNSNTVVGNKQKLTNFTFIISFKK